MAALQTFAFLTKASTRWKCSVRKEYPSSSTICSAVVCCLTRTKYICSKLIFDTRDLEKLSESNDNIAEITPTVAATY